MSAPLPLRAELLGENERGRLLTKVALSIGLWTPVFVTALYFVAPLWLAGVALACGTVMLASPLVLRLTGSAALAANLLLAALGTVCTTVAPFVGGLKAGSLAWLALLPVLGAMLVGRRTGLAWLAVVSATYTGLLVAASTGGLEARVAPAALTFGGAALDVAGLLGLAVVAFATAWQYESMRLAALAVISVKNQQLEEAARRIQELHALVPICMHCHRIRRSDEGKTWERVESYVSRYLDVKFSHGLCEACLAEHYPDDP